MNAAKLLMLSSSFSSRQFIGAAGKPTIMWTIYFLISKLFR